MNYYISIDGNDAWSGRLPEVNAEKSDGPFATLEGARDAIRRLKADSGYPPEGVVVSLRAGDYPRRTTFHLQAEDSGSAASPVIYRPYGDEKVRLLGGSVVSRFLAVSDPAIRQRLHADVRDLVLQADLKALGITEVGKPRNNMGVDDPNVPAPPEFFFAGKPMVRSRYPNLDAGDGGWTHIVRGGGIAVDSGHHEGWTLSPLEEGFIYEGDRPSQWQKHDHIWVRGFWGYDFSITTEEVDRIDLEKHLVLNKPPYGTYGFQANHRFFFLNILEELDQPGEYYIDHDSLILYFLPPQPVEAGEALVSALKEPVIQMQEASNIILQGLKLEGGRGSGIVIEEGNHTSIRGCTLWNFGSHGIFISGGRNHTVQSCDIVATGDNGIRVRGGDRATLTPGGHVIDNNHIQNYSRLSGAFTPAILMHGVSNRLSHNEIDDAAAIGIYFIANESVLEFNNLHDICRDGGDVGGIYTGRQYTARGNMIRHNFIHEIGGYGNIGSNGMYFDDCMSGQTLFGNVFRNSPHATFIGGGRDLTIENNIYIGCEPAIQMDARGLDPAPVWRNLVYDMNKKTYDEMNVTQPPYCDRYPELLVLEEYYKQEDGIPPGNIHIRRNMCVGVGTWLKFHWLADTKYVTLEDNLVTVDPRFVDADKGDYRLMPDSPVWKTGFKPIPFDQIGLYKDEFRP